MGKKVENGGGWGTSFSKHVQINTQTFITETHTYHDVRTTTIAATSL